MRDLLLQGGWIKIVSDQTVERSVHGVGSRSLLIKGPWWGPGATPRPGSRGQSPRNSWVCLGFLRPQNASPRIIFFHFPNKFCCKSVDHVDIPHIPYEMINLDPFSSERAYLFT